MKMLYFGDIGAGSRFQRSFCGFVLVVEDGLLQVFINGKLNGAQAVTIPCRCKDANRLLTLC